MINHFKVSNFIHEDEMRIYKSNKIYRKIFIFIVEINKRTKKYG
jgi:hypothetical protein